MEATALCSRLRMSVLLLLVAEVLCDAQEADGVFLEGPGGPVMEGDSVTLHCRNSKDPSKRIADFYRQGDHLLTGYEGEMTIPRVAKDDEGLYKCSISGYGESAEIQLGVQENLQKTQTILFFRTVFISVAVAMMSLLVGLLHCGKISNE